MKFMVAFSSPKRSAKTVEVAAQHARALGAELIILKMIPDPEKVGVVAQLIATDRPAEKGREQIDEAARQLVEQGVNARGIVAIGEVAPGIIKIAQEEQVDLVFVGTTNVARRPFFLMEKDPIVHYLVDRCPIPLFLVRYDGAPAESEQPASQPE